MQARHSLVQEQVEFAVGTNLLLNEFGCYLEFFKGFWKLLIDSELQSLMVFRQSLNNVGLTFSCRKTSPHFFGRSDEHHLKIIYYKNVLKHYALE